MITFVKDCLGSVRSVVDLSDGTVLERNDYYAYGERVADSTMQTTSLNRWRYNAKEEQDSIASIPYLDYGARLYDPVIGRWMQQDPVAAKYPHLSPYNFCGGNPVNFVDPDGKDPIYAKNFWGKVKLIGDDGKKSTGSYLVRGSVARSVKAATKSGLYYTGNLSESKNVMHIPTGQIQKDVQSTVLATINSGTSPETRVEYGGHALNSDSTARLWDSGSAMQTQTLQDGSIETRWSVKPFRIGGKDNQIGGPASDIKYFWHTHPDGSSPSQRDKWWIGELRKYGFAGNSFLIDVKNGRVAFFNENGILINIKYDVFTQMGNQSQIK